MNSSELLAATGNIWKVKCWDTGNRRACICVYFVRAKDVLAAEEIGRRRSGRRCVDASPWNPTRESCYGTLIQKQVEVPA